MKQSEIYGFVLDYFARNKAGATTELHFSSPYQLLVAVMLSAQCTDERINKVTPPLFAAYPDIYSLAHARAEQIFEYIKSVSYPNAKSKHLAEMARAVVEKFKGIIPDDFDSLVSLPGVGRKTANVILSVAFGRTALAVDTHVFRVSRRLGLVPLSCNTPVKVEQELLRHIPCELVGDSHHWLLLHGRYVCKARRPECDKCGINTVCRHYMAATRGKSNRMST